MYSICSLLFPFAWQNIFVPIIPERFLDYVTAPMPFIVGVHTSLMPQVERIPGIEDEVVRPQPRFRSCFGDEEKRTLMTTRLVAAR